MSHAPVTEPAARNIRKLDVYAMFISGLCLIHCLALPLSVLPIAAALGDNEWVHRVLVVLAFPATALVVRAARSHRLFVTFAITGLTLLLTGAFVTKLEAYETWLTVAGSMCLGGAHLWHNLHHRASILSPRHSVEGQGDMGA